MNPPFALYSEEHPWFTFADYGAVLDIMARLSATRVLEFGPGSSTLALIEGGAVHIDSCEADPDWLAVYQRRLAPHAAIVALHAYQHEDPLAIAAIDNQRFDFGFVDGPRDTSRRGAEIRYALDRCLWVACHDGMAAPIVAAMDQASAARRRVEVIRYDRNPGEPHAIGLIGPC